MFGKTQYGKIEGNITMHYIGDKFMTAFAENHMKAVVEFLLKKRFLKGGVVPCLKTILSRSWNILYYYFSLFFLNIVVSLFPYILSFHKEVFIKTRKGKKQHIFITVTCHNDTLIHISVELNTHTHVSSSYFPFSHEV